MLYSARLASFRKSGANKPAWPGLISPVDMARAGFIYRPEPDANDNVQCFSCAVEVNGWDPEDNPVSEHLRCNPECCWARVLALDDHDVDDRIATFIDWPHKQRGFRPTPLSLAQAGFFFNPATKGDDTVECAFCQAALNRWEKNDNPVEEHYNTNPECPHIQLFYETSSLVESSLGIIPELGPAISPVKAPISLAPPGYEQSGIDESELEHGIQPKAEPIYVNLLEESTRDNTMEMQGSMVEASNISVPDQTKDMTEDRDENEDQDDQAQTLSDANPSLENSNEINEGTNTSAHRLQSPKSTDEKNAEPKEKNSTVSDVETTDQTIYHTLASINSRDPSLVPYETPQQQYTDNASTNVNDSTANDTTENVENDTTLGNDLTEPSGYASMVTVSVQEISVDSSENSCQQHSQELENLRDPETPKSNNTPQKASSLTGNLPLSVFQGPFTSTPFNSLSPNKLIHQAPMPSPLAALPIDIARTSFGEQPDPNVSIKASDLYPRMPSFPSMRESHAQTGTTLESVGQSNREESVYHSAADEDRSTPSPVRSPMRSSIIGSSPVKNSFDQLVADLNSSLEDPEIHADTSMRDAPDQSVVSEEPSTAERLESQDPLAVQITLPTIEQLMREFGTGLPPSSLQFLLEAKGVTVREWQSLLADEVERHLIRVTEQAIEEAEAQREHVIAQIRAQYER